MLALTDYAEKCSLSDTKPALGIEPLFELLFGLDCVWEIKRVAKARLRFSRRMPKK
jgi:hypothetical protein